ncbi:MAG: DUF3822 family protein [Mucilaginibacter sp.]|uniref:DUF3822 family protein n=1 Tax=Mucilaginibacter sp. TaxID=1882438 RepID=UPI0034E39B33
MHFVPINFTDPGFNPAYTADFELLVVINQHHFSYAVRHPATQRLVRVNTGNGLDELWNEEKGSELIASNYKKVNIAIETQSFCLVPNAVFSQEDLLDYTKFLVVKEADVILTDEIENGDNTVIFTFPKEVISKLTAQFQTSKIEFAPKGWIKAVMQAQLPGQNLYLYLEENRLQLLFPEGENIRFYNQFDCSTLDELVYFTALVTEQLKLKPEETTLILCGRIEEGGEQQLYLQQFFDQVSLFNSADFRQHSVLKQNQVANFLGLA